MKSAMKESMDTQQQKMVENQLKMVNEWVPFTDVTPRGTR